MARKMLTHTLLVLLMALRTHTQSSIVPSASTSGTQASTSIMSSASPGTTLAPTTGTHGTLPGEIVFTTAAANQVADTQRHTYQVLDTPQMFSDKWEVGKRLIGYVQMRMDVVSLASCFSECTRMHPRCESLNMALKFNSNTSLYACELNRKSVDDDQMAQITDPAYIYYDVFNNKYDWA